MITIPIWLFVILVTLSFILTLIVGIYIVSYLEYCKYKDNKTNVEIDRLYQKNHTKSK